MAKGFPRRASLGHRHAGAAARVTTIIALGALTIGRAPATAVAQGRERPSPTQSAYWNSATLTYDAAAVEQKPVLLDPDRLAAAVAMLRGEPEDSSPPPVTFILRFVVDAGGRIDTSRLRTLFWIVEPSSVARAQPDFLAVPFRPGTLGGAPVPTEVGVPVEFVDGRARPLIAQGTWNPGVDSLPNLLSRYARKDRAAGEAGGKVPDVADAEVKPRLANAAQVQRALQRLYPPALRDAGVMGYTTLKFVIDAQGRTNPGSIVVLSTSHPDFAGASAAAVTVMRFRPARIGRKSVPVLVEIPIAWILERPTPPIPKEPP